MRVLNMPHLNPVSRFTLRSQAADCAARCGWLAANGHELPTPIVWAGETIDKPLRPWQHMPIPAVMVNAFPLLTSRQLLAQLTEQGFSEYLGTNIAVFLDSGGFLLQQNPYLKVNHANLKPIYSALRPMLAAVLDYPPHPSLGEAANIERWQKTLAATTDMLKWDCGTTVIPVVHGWSEETLRKACRDIRELCNPSMVALGGMVLRMKGSARRYAWDGYESTRLQALDFVRIARQEFPQAFLHVFGVGSPLAILVMFALGADSVDSVCWRLKAAYGAILLPGRAECYTAPQNPKRRRANKIDLALLEQCACPVCSGTPSAKRLNALNSFEKRAVHNLWVVLQEVALARNHIQQGAYLPLLKERLGDTMLWRLLKCSLGRQAQYRLDFE